MSDDPNDVRGALRGASDGLLVAIREVEARERIKRAVPLNDPSFPPLARHVRVAAEAVLLLAREEEKRAEEAAASEASEARGRPTINETRPPADLATILAEWRAVERELEMAAPSSPEAARLMERFERLRDAYAAALKGYRPD